MFRRPLGDISCVIQPYLAGDNGLNSCPSSLNPYPSRLRPSLPPPHPHCLTEFQGLTHDITPVHIYVMSRHQTQLLKLCKFVLWKALVPFWKGKSHAFHLSTLSYGLNPQSPLCNTAVIDWNFGGWKSPRQPGRDAHHYMAGALLVASNAGKACMHACI